MPTQTDLVGPALSRGRSLDHRNQHLSPRMQRKPLRERRALIGCEQHAEAVSSSRVSVVVSFLGRGRQRHKMLPSRIAHDSLLFPTARTPTFLATICTTCGFAVAVLTARALLSSPLRRLPAEFCWRARNLRCPPPQLWAKVGYSASHDRAISNQFIDDALKQGQSQNDDNEKVGVARGGRPNPSKLAASAFDGREARSTPKV